MNKQSTSAIIKWLKSLKKSKNIVESKVGEKGGRKIPKLGGALIPFFFCKVQSTWTSSHEYSKHTC